MSDRPTFRERLDDPLSHFPYKLEDALSWAGEPGRDVVYATDAYIKAQTMYLRAPSQETRAAEREAADVLVTARREQRERRDDLARAARAAQSAQQDDPGLEG